MTMMMRLLLLPLCFMHLKEVVGTITFTTDGSLVQTGAEVAMSCKDTDKMDIDIYFGGQAIVSCDLFANLCPVSDPALYSASIDITPAGYNLLTFTIKSFAVSNCGEYTCQKNADTSVNDATTVEHKLSHGENCSTCGQCFPSTLMECSSTCKCNAGYTYDGSACGPPTTTTATTTTTMPTTTTTTPSTTTTTATPTTTSLSTTTTTTTPTTTAIETTTTSTTTTLTSKHEELSSTTGGSSESSNTNSSSVLPTTSSPNVSNERTVIIVVASTVGGVVLVGLVVFLVGLFLYRARRPGHGHGKHSGSHKRTTRRQQSGGSYIYSGPNNSQNREMYPRMASYMDTRHGYPYSIKGYPDRHLGVSVPKQSEQRHEGSQMRNTNYVKSKYSVYPRSANTSNFSQQHYHRYGERQRPATTGNIHPGYVYPSHQSGYPHNQTGDYSDNWNMY